MHAQIKVSFPFLPWAKLCFIWRDHLDVLTLGIKAKAIYCNYKGGLKSCLQHCLGGSFQTFNWEHSSCSDRQQKSGINSGTRSWPLGSLGVHIILWSKAQKKWSTCQVWKLNRISSVDLESPDMSVELGQGRKMSTALVHHHWPAGSADTCCSLQLSVCFS